MSYRTAEDQAEYDAARAYLLKSDGKLPTPDQFMSVGPWVDIEATLASGRHNGVHKLASSLRGAGGLSFEEYVAEMETVWLRIDQTQAGHEYTRDEFESDIRDVWERYPDGKMVRDDKAARICFATIEHMIATRAVETNGHAAPEETDSHAQYVNLWSARPELQRIHDFAL